jgi:hypothetical protein
MENLLESLTKSELIKKKGSANLKTEFMQSEDREKIK